MDPKDIYVRTGTWVVYIRYRGVWDFDDLYKSMNDWFKERKYYVQEVFHKHKRYSPFGVDQQFKWTAERREEDYVGYNIEIFMRTYDIHDFPVTLPGGQKKTFSKGRLWIEFRSFVEYDYQKQFDKSAFYSQLRNFYHKYIIKKKMEAIWWDQLYYREIHKLHRLIKERLKMETRDYEHQYWVGVHR